MSRSPAINTISLRSLDDKYSPPEKVLNVCIVGDVCFLSICKYEETHDTEKTVEEAHFEVDTDALYDALTILIRDHNGAARKEPM